MWEKLFWGHDLCLGPPWSPPKPDFQNLFLQPLILYDFPATTKKQSHLVEVRSGGEHHYFVWVYVRHWCFLLLPHLLCPLAVLWRDKNICVCVHVCVYVCMCVCVCLAPHLYDHDSSTSAIHTPPVPCTFTLYHLYTPKIPQGYGLTETCAASFISNPFDNRHLGTVGIPLAHTDLRLEAVPEMGWVIVVSALFLCSQHLQPCLMLIVWDLRPCLRWGEWQD